MGRAAAAGAPAAGPVQRRAQSPAPAACRMRSPILPELLFSSSLNYLLQSPRRPSRKFCFGLRESLSNLNDDALGLNVMFERFHALFTAVAAQLVTAERSLDGPSALIFVHIHLPG